MSRSLLVVFLTTTLSAIPLATKTAAQTCTAPPTGMVSWYRMEGTATDWLGTNDPSSTSALSFVAGEVNQGVTFGSGGFIDIPDSTALRLQTFTLDAWARPDGPGPNDDGAGSVIVGKNVNSNDVSAQINWTTQSGGRFRFSFSTNPGTSSILSADPFPAGAFYHVAATYDGAVFQLYVNGVLEGSSASAAGIEYSNFVWDIGANNPSARGIGFPRTWNGVIDEVEIFDRALSASEIAALYAAGSAGKCPCGDNVVDVSEQCDDGNQTSGDGCDANCTTTACGNGIVTTGEECDDGNVVSGDGCSATCQSEMHIVGWWPFEGGDADDVTGNFGATTLSGASVVGGQLQVSASAQSFAQTGVYSGPDLQGKTLVSWVYLDSLTDVAGSALTIERQTGHIFDAIDYAERQANTWMAGSNFFLRSEDPPQQGTAENSSPSTLVKLAIVYGDDDSITIYRNDVLYSTYTKGALETYPGAADTDVIFGLRHAAATSPNRYLTGRIEEARIYNAPLTATQLASLTPVHCDDGDPCTTDGYDPSTGTCTHVSNDCPTPTITPTPTVTATATPTTTPTPLGSCSNPLVVPAGGGTFTGTTSGTSHLTGGCDGGNVSPELVYGWTPDVTGWAEISTCSAATNFDTVLYVRSGSCGGTEAACNTLGAGCTTAGSKLVVDVTAGQPYFIVVDGYNGESGSFSLTITPPGSDVRPISGKKLLIKDNADHTKRKIIFLSKDINLDTTGAGVGIDPFTYGARLQVYNADGGSDSACIDLPSSNWGFKPGPQFIFKYKDSLYAHGPCKVAKVKGRSILKVVCQAKVQPIDYSLDEASQSTVGVRFNSGTVTYCAEFGGTVKKDSGTDPPIAGGKGQFAAKDAPAPLTCPTAPVPCP